METKTSRWTLSELSQVLDGSFDGPADLPLNGPAPADSDDPTAIAFAESDKYLQLAERSLVGAVIIRNDDRSTSKPCIRVVNPRLAFGMVLALTDRPLPLDPGMSAAAWVHPEATVDPTASIGPFVVIERGASVGPNCKVFANCYIGENCSVGADSILYPGVVIYQDVSIGEGCILHSGVILGADGFAFLWDGKVQRKVPQVGRTVVEKYVEIGANSCIDRAMCGVTTIHQGVKIDNLVQVGHNSEIGEHTVIASGAGISGSTRIGKRNTLAGQTATSDHVSTCDDVILAGRTAVTNDIKVPGPYFGVPARPFQEAIKAAALATKLPDLLTRIRALEAKVRELEAGK